MITMKMLGKVKRLHSRGKLSLHEIAKQAGLSRNTIRKGVRDTEQVDNPTNRRAVKTAWKVGSAQRRAKQLKLAAEFETSP